MSNDKNSGQGFIMDKSGWEMLRDWMNFEQDERRRDADPERAMFEIVYPGIILSLLYSWGHGSLNQTVVVQIAQGQVRGGITSTVNGQMYYYFKGIPYAKSPEGPLRFKAPQPPDSWEGVRDALEMAPECPQPFGTGVEDCLLLNVLTPKLPVPSEQLQPVIVYIHGGGFVGCGAKSQTADFFLEEGIVFVSMNYRLGALGFLSTGDSVVPGNNGLKDQAMALRWVQQNIAYFGGDPGNVTIFGRSAGAGSVHFHVLSPMSRGLFHRAIAQSGSALCPWAFEDASSARNRTLRYGEALGANTSDSQALVDFLRTLSIKDIVDGVGKAQNDLEKLRGIGFFRPTAESANSGEIFLPQAPVDIITQGTFNHVPFISGTVSQETIIYLPGIKWNNSLMEFYNENFDILLPEDLKIELNTSLSKEIAGKVKNFYFGKKNLTIETLIQYVNMYSDQFLVYGVNKHVRMHAAVSTAPVYQYFFTYDGRLGSGKRFLFDDFPGVPHNDEGGYMFYMVEGNPDFSSTSPDMVIMARVIKMWTNFFRYGNPTPKVEELFQNVTWSPATETQHFYLNIGNNLKLEQNLLGDRMTLWDEVYQNVTNN